MVTGTQGDMRIATAVWAARTIGSDRRAHRRRMRPRPEDPNEDASVATVARENPTAMTVVLTPPTRWVSPFFLRFFFLFAPFGFLISPPTCRHLFLVE